LGIIRVQICYVYLKVFFSKNRLKVKEKSLIKTNI